MKDKVLYFPYINVPTESWFTQILLYWDEVGTIVPYEYIENPEKLQPHMRSLVQERLVTQIIPDLYETGISFDDFEKYFIKLLEKYGIDAKAQRSKFGPIHYSKIHSQKIGRNLLDELVHRQLAIAEDGFGSWYRVESVTAGLYMGYLASVLGNSDRYNMQPITDDISSLLTFTEEYAIGAINEYHYADRSRIDILKRILPAPKELWHIDEIIDFKEKYGDLLPKFRKKIEFKLAEISIVKDQREIDLLINNFEHSLKDELEDLASKLRIKNWSRIFFGTICGLTSSFLPGVRAVLTEDWSTGFQAIPGLLGAVYSAYDGHKTKQKQIMESPLAYAVFMKREFESY